MAAVVIGGAHPGAGTDPGAHSWGIAGTVPFRVPLPPMPAHCSNKEENQFIYLMANGVVSDVTLGKDFYRIAASYSTLTVKDST